MCQVGRRFPRGNLLPEHPWSASAHPKLRSATPGVDPLHAMPQNKKIQKTKREVDSSEVLSWIRKIYRFRNTHQEVHELIFYSSASQNRKSIVKSINQVIRFFHTDGKSDQIFGDSTTFGKIQLFVVKHRKGLTALVGFGTHANPDR